MFDKKDKKLCVIKTKQNRLQKLSAKKIKSKTVIYYQLNLASILVCKGLLRNNK